jgi:hypothetical protein
MTLIIYPILLVLAAVLFYLLGKRNGTEREVIKTVIESKPIELYEDETEEEFYIRSHNFIRETFKAKGIKIFTSDDYRSTSIGFSDPEEEDFMINIEAFYKQGNSYLMLYTKINSTPIPDNKIAATSELVNRLNNALILSVLQMNYEHRAIEGIVIYHPCGQAFDSRNFEYHYGALLNSRYTITAFKRVITNGEEPALVSLDYKAS